MKESCAPGWRMHAFFYQSDLEISNDERVEMLKRVLFQAELGTLYAKAERTAKLGELLAEAVNPGGVTMSKMMTSRNKW
jgi:glycyl-tRNA synthetase beta subunit